MAEHDTDTSRVLPRTADTPGVGYRSYLQRYRTVVLLILAISLLHYNTHIHIHALHEIYRRLYYFPIILAAFRDERRGGILAALLVILLYVPHALGIIGLDPGSMTGKVLEMLLYLMVGLLTGTLVARLNAARDRLARTAEDLQVSLDQKTVMETELIRSARLAAVGRLSAGLAHEIRNPLASIKGSAEILSDDFPPEHPKARMLTILQEETGRLNQVLARFLDFARSEPGEIAAFDLAAECRAVAELMAHHPDSPPVTVQLQPDPGPALGDREQIRQVLLNLVLNAAAAAGPTGNVRLEVNGDHARIICRVLDSGPGFSAAAVANFGTPFFSTKSKGTGLGLATSLRIVEDLGGTLAVDTARIAGACVILTLPAAGSKPL